MRLWTEIFEECEKFRDHLFEEFAVPYLDVTPNIERLPKDVELYVIDGNNPLTHFVFYVGLDQFDHFFKIIGKILH